MKGFSLARTIFWVALTPAAYWLGWLDSVKFVSLISIWALVETAFAAWRSDVNPDQDELHRKLDEIQEALGGSRSRPPESR